MSRGSGLAARWDPRSTKDTRYRAGTAIKNAIPMATSFGGVVNLEYVEFSRTNGDAGKRFDSGVNEVARLFGLGRGER